MKFLKILTYIIPILILLWILYLNYLPFGYSYKKVLDVGRNDHRSDIVFLEGGGEKQKHNGETFRFIDNIAYIVYKPKVILKNPTLNLTLDGDNLYFHEKPDIDFKWDKKWDNQNILDNFYGVVMNDKAKEKDSFKRDCLYLDGKRRYVLSGSVDEYNKGPFAIYLEWIPEKGERAQQILGKYNWEIFQNEENITFQIGKTEPEGSFFSLSYNIDSSFFNEKHSLLAIYNPGENGYIEMFVDDIFVGREYIGEEIISPTYGERKLTLGWSAHGDGKYPMFQGSICNLNFAYKELESKKTNKLKINIKNKQNIKIPIIGEGNLKKVIFEVKQ